MNRTDSILLTVTLSVISFAATYYWSPPAPRYVPLERRWSMNPRPDQPSMGWYGRSAWGLGVAAVVGSLTFAATRPRSNPHGTNRTLPVWCVQGLTWLALGALTLLALHIVLHEFPITNSP